MLVDYTDHPQVSVLSRSGEVEVDVLLKPLLTACWALGMETQWSCQGDASGGRWPDERAYVLFTWIPLVEDFLRYLRFNHGGFAGAYDVEWVDENAEFLRSPGIRSNYFGIERDFFQGEERVTIRFPSERIGEVEAVLASFGKWRSEA